MKEVKILSDVKQAKRLLPAWLAPFVAYLLMIIGQIFASFALLAFYLLLGSRLGMSRDIASLLRSNSFIQLSAFLFIALVVFACLYLLASDTIWGIAGIHSAWNFVQGNI
ncbi:hypothetical protein [Streptococcus oricebi]|uniref:hypothetical protein n=1 Tax=Streptococcus oricebi TaxID=1547447 RepID=UPI001FDA6419|nr:hypothetical protein [Streptococcus oricebi]